MNLFWGGEKMNKKIFAFVTMLLICSTVLTPFVLAAPWIPKNNEKFQSFSTTHTPDITPILSAEKDYRPTAYNPNIIIVSWEEIMDEYEIMIGEEPYSLHDDFEYEGNSKWTAIGYPFGAFMGILPVGNKANHWRVEYTFDFSVVPGGIDGKLEMLMVHNNGETSIRSLSGTGDLQNVQIMATAVLGIHDGIVKGWPAP